MFLYHEPDETSIGSAVEVLLKKFDNLQGIVKKGDKVLIKPNFVAPFPKATTDLAILEGLVNAVKRIGAIPIIGESSGFEFNTGTTFKILGLEEFSQRNNVEVVNFDTDSFVEMETGWDKIKRFKVARLAAESDVIINVPKLKKHSLTKVTFGMKNLFGVLHRDSRRLIHAYNLEKGIYTLNKIISPKLTIVDGTWSLESAVYSEASYRGLLIAGEDVRMVDYVCCNLLGEDYTNVPHIAMGIDSKLLDSLNLVNLSEGDYSISERNINNNAGPQIKSNLKKQIYKMMYKFDILYNSVFHYSSIPDIHLNLGVKPYIVKKVCNQCGVCKEVCEAKAIDINRTGNYDIDYQKCKYVRCLKCKDSCPQKAIITKGFH